jgi:hypothetical protein
MANYRLTRATEADIVDILEPELSVRDHPT